MSFVAYTPPGKRGESCSTGGSKARYVIAVLMLAFGTYLAVKAYRTHDTLTAVLSLAIIVYAVFRAYGKAG